MASYDRDRLSLALTRRVTKLVLTPRGRSCVVGKFVKQSVIVLDSYSRSNDPLDCSKEVATEINLSYR